MIKLLLLVFLGFFAAIAGRFLRWHLLQRKEQHVLQKKYGDLPMFEDFFRRLGQENRHRAR